MSDANPRESRVGLEKQGLTNPRSVQWNLTPAELYEFAARRGEGQISADGPIVVHTGIHTGRSAQDKFVVEDPETKDKVWWGKVNKPFPEDKFDRLLARAQAYLQGRDLFVLDCHVGADPTYRLPLRLVTENAWHCLFARCMFIPLTDTGAMQSHDPEFSIIHVPNFVADPERDGTRSETFIILHLARKIALIGGTLYAGEIKKSMFTVMNFLLPQQSVGAMHCSANVGDGGDSALFFGLSGTGKTTLSADPARGLIGDDEHGWSDDGVFNFEGGCYAKVIRLEEESEPEIYSTTKRFGTVLENVVMDPVTRKLDLDDGTLTENTRAAYPIDFISNYVPGGRAGHPKNVVLLTCDAFGVLPPIAKLTPEQAMYHFISGYTAKVAGTEKGLGNEPVATFSACFGSPFLVLHPFEYADILQKKIAEHGSDCWLVNTGWSGGPFGVGQRMKIKHTRAMVNAALAGALGGVDYTEDPIFRLQVPTSCPGVPAEVLQPRETWPDKSAYDAKARELAQRFHDNFTEFADRTSEAIRNAGPIRPEAAKSK